MYDNMREAWNIAKNLHKKSNRIETGFFLIEGKREIDLAIAHGIEIIQIFDKTNTSAKNLERISYCGQVVALAKKRKKNLQDLNLPESKPGDVLSNPLLIILDRIEKPGNIGAIIRTAEAAGVTAMLITDGVTDLCNPNLIRASLGAAFCLPVIEATSDDAIRWLEQNKISIVTATPDAALNYFEYDFNCPAAIVLGSEAHGVSQIWRDNAQVSVTIPMIGEVNSLNVSASAAILIYEAVSRRMKP